jgi:DNA-directed RNA polymerase subunit RPC12/RpoP
MNCKGPCSRYKTTRPHKEPYATHYMCSRCRYWGTKESLTETNRCPCCNFRPRMKNFKQNVGVRRI